MSSPEREVLAANQAFYDAFERGDFGSIEGMWARGVPVVCVHPGWDALHGREEVLASFRSILDHGTPKLRCTRPSAYVLGETAYVVCGERVDENELVATNLFVREEGVWRLVFHTAGPVHRRVERRPRTPPRGLLN